jgi:hypothetical protein
MFYVFTVRSAAAVSCLRCMRMYVYYRRVLTVTKILGFGICEHVTLCHSPSTLEVLRTCLLHIGPTNDRRRVPVRGRESPSLFGHAGGRASDGIPEAKRILYLRDFRFQTRSDKSVPMACICESQVSIVYRDIFWKLAVLF